MKNRVEIVVLSVIILLLATYIIFRKDQKINYTLPKMTTIESDEITKIDYKGFEFVKEGDEWFLPSGYKASESVMSRITSEISNIALIDMISLSKDYKRFELESDNLLKVYKNEKEILNLNIGSTSSTGNYTYVKFTNRDEIYSIRGDIKDILTENEDNLRSKVVLSFHDVDNIIITNGDNEKTLSDEASEELQLYINNLKASTFKELPRGEILLSIAITGADSHTLIIYEAVDGEYPSTSSDVDFPFTLPEYIVNKLLEI